MNAPVKPTKQDVRNHRILIQGLIGQTLKDPNTLKFEEECEVLRRFTTNEADINETILAMQSIKEKSASS